MEDRLISMLKDIKAVKRKVDKLHSTKTYDYSPKQMQKHGDKLAFELMYIERLKKDFCRLFDKSDINVGTEEVIFKPSSFQEYKY